MRILAIRLPAAIFGPVAASLLLVACGGHTSKPAITPGAGTAQTSVTAAVTLDDLRAVVPSNWALEDWAASPDGQYVVLIESTARAARIDFGPPESLIVYHRLPNGALVEAARYLGVCCETYAHPRFAHDAQLLVPDASGVRHLNVAWEKLGTLAQGVPPESHIVIDAGGKVIVDKNWPSNDPATVMTASGSIVVDPIQIVAAAAEARFSSESPPSPPQTVPAGAVPAGWRVLQSLASPDGKTFAVLTESRLDREDQLSTYQIRDGRLVERWRMVNTFINLDAGLTFHDVNGDGQPEVVYSSSNGGNSWTQGGTVAATLRPDGLLEELQFRLPIAASAPRGPIDINHDGVYEWTAVDASWELTAFCHACSPSSEFILAWDGTAYSDASARFGDAIVAQHTDPVPPAAGAPCRDQDSYLSALVGRYLDYWNAGRKDAAARVRAQVGDYNIDSRLVSKRDVILRAIADDPHRSLTTSESAVAYDCPT